MSLLRRFLPAFLALVLVAEAPLHALTAAADSPCVLETTGDAGCCDDEASAPGCASICPIGGAAVIADNGHVLGISASVQPDVRPSVQPATQARAPDTAPPKTSIT